MRASNRGILGDPQRVEVRPVPVLQPTTVPALTPMQPGLAVNSGPRSNGSAGGWYSPRPDIDPGPPVEVGPGPAQPLPPLNPPIGNPPQNPYPPSDSTACNCGCQSTIAALVVAMKEQQEINTANLNVLNSLKQTNETNNQWMQQLETNITNIKDTKLNYEEIAAEVAKRRRPASIRIVDPQGKFTTDFVQLRDGREVDLEIDLRSVTTPAQ